MAKKKTTAHRPPAQKPFSSSPFAALKGVEVASPVAVVPVKPEKSAEPPRKTISSDELFLQAMSGVRPIDEAVKAVSRKQKASSAGKPSPKLKQAAVLLRDEVVARKAFMQEVAKLKLDVRFSDHIPEDDELRPLAGNRLKQLKRGVVTLNRQLDLHGLTREEALESLAHFMRSARQAAEKAVLIITGKGRHSVDGPVLQQAVASWLRDQGRELLLEYAPAPQELGGSGAFVVFVRPLDKPVKE